MADVQRGLIIRDDVAFWDGVTRTASRVDATGGTVTGLNFGDEVDVLQVFGDGSSRSDATIDIAISRLGGASATLLFSTGTWLIADNLTIPSNCTCHVAASCVFSVASGKTLTFSGLVFRESETWTAGDGTVVGGAAATVNYDLTTGESGVTIVNRGYKPAVVLRYGDNTTQGTTDMLAIINRMTSTLTQDVVAGNPGMKIPFGDYSITDTIVIPDSASQWTLTGEGRARSSSIQATSALAGKKMISGINLRECTIERLELLGDVNNKPSHGIYLDRDSGTQTGTGGPGKIDYKDLLIRGVDIGVEIVQTTGGNNDEHNFNGGICGGDIDKWGIKITNTNAAWTTIRDWRFDGCVYADISNIVVIGESRGGAAVVSGCRHISGILAYEIGDCRYFTIEAPRIEQHDNLLRSSGPYLEAADLSITGSDTFNSASAALPTVASGDLIWTRNFTNSANVGVFKATGTPSTSAIQVVAIGGGAPSLTNESAGATAQIAPTKLLTATEKTTCDIRGGEVTTTDPFPIVWDGDTDEHVLSLSGKFNLTNSAAIVCMGNATVVIGDGRYQVSELIVEDGVIEIMAGAVFTAGTVTQTYLGTGRIVNHGCKGGNIDQSTTWNPGSIADAASETSSTITVSGARAGDHVQAFAGEDLQGMSLSGYVSANDTVELVLQNLTGGAINLSSRVYHCRVFPAT